MYVYRFAIMDLSEDKQSSVVPTTNRQNERQDVLATAMNNLAIQTTLQTESVPQIPYVIDRTHPIEEIIRFCFKRTEGIYQDEVSMISAILNICNSDEHHIGARFPVQSKRGKSTSFIISALLLAQDNVKVAIITGSVKQMYEMKQELKRIGDLISEMHRSHGFNEIQKQENICVVLGRGIMIQRMDHYITGISKHDVIMIDDAVLLPTDFVQTVYQKVKSERSAHRKLVFSAYAPTDIHSKQVKTDNMPYILDAKAYAKCIKLPDALIPQVGEEFVLPSRMITLTRLDFKLAQKCQTKSTAVLDDGTELGTYVINSTDSLAAQARLERNEYIDEYKKYQQEHGFVNDKLEYVL